MMSYLGRAVLSMLFWSLMWFLSPRLSELLPSVSMSGWELGARILTLWYILFGIRR